MCQVYLKIFFPLLPLLPLLVLLPLPSSPASLPGFPRFPASLAFLACFACIAMPYPWRESKDLVRPSSALGLCAVRVSGDVLLVTRHKKAGLLRPAFDLILFTLSGL